uniref:Uncharacterized protein n=1 Tax=Panagrolaimus sp. PS1159 TaxID=55785 RepID=A0AC35EUK9_9BILA
KNDEAALHCGNGFCGFRVDGDNMKIDLMDVHVLKMSLDNPCLPIRMEQTVTSYCGEYAASCKPFIVDKRITIIVVEDVSSTCPTYITNAKIYYPQTTTSTSLPSSKSSTQTATSEASNEWYIWVIIGVAFVLLIGIIIAIFVCWKKQICVFKKKTEAAKKRTTIMDTAESGGIVRKAEDIPEPKLES